MPPLTQMGDRFVPMRALPVCFCGQSFLRGALDLAARLGVGVALALVGLVDHHDLVEELLAHLVAEELLVDRDGARALAVLGEQRQISHG